MIELVRGNLLTADVEALVNTVNTVGYMGKGIALQFKQAFPANFAAYEKACSRGEVEIGRMFVFDTGNLVTPRYIINFPTKRHWRNKSRLEDIEAGLIALVEEVRARQIGSIAIPPLGCGLGGLDWNDVRPRIEMAFAALPDVHVLLFEPAGSPAAENMPVGTKAPAMTAARALLVGSMARYAAFAYRMTLLEVQKLAYFLQEVGEPLRLQYAKGHYGPYAHNLNKVLELMEGHWIRGYGDSQERDAEIRLLPAGVTQAEEYLRQDEAARARLERLAQVIEGFETPYGMELIASVHWVANKELETFDNSVAIAQRLATWNKRKQAMFKPQHVDIAVHRLAAQQLLPQKQV